MENETDEVVSGVSTLSMAVERSGPLSFADICDLGAEVATKLAEQHDAGEVHGHVAVGSVVRLDDGPWRLAPADLVPDVDPVLAPELQGGAVATPAGDVYALGAVLSFGLTGEAVEPVAPTDVAAAEGEVEVDGAADAVDEDPVDAIEPEATRVALDPDGEPNLVLSADDLDRLRNFGGTGSPDPATDDLTDDRADPGGDDEPIDLTDGGDHAIDADAPVTLPEVMSSFLVALRGSLAVDPADRPSASDLAATLRQLRADADTAMGGALVGGAPTVVIGDPTAGGGGWGDPDVADAELPPPPVAAAAAAAAAAGAAEGAGAAGVLTVEGTGSAATLGAAATKAKTKKGAKERLPLFVAAAAILVALFLGVSLARERGANDPDLLAVGPTQGTTVRRSTTTSVPALPVDLIVETTTTLPTSTTSSTSTTAPPAQQVVPDTTAPTVETTTTTAPPTTLPSTTTTVPGVPFKVAKVTCALPANPANPCQLFESADATSAPRSGQLPNGVNLQATCIKGGEPPFPGALDTWLLIIGPAPTYSGWLSATHLGGSIPQVLPCQANQSL